MTYAILHANIPVTAHVNLGGRPGIVWHDTHSCCSLRYRDVRVRSHHACEHGPTRKAIGYSVSDAFIQECLYDLFRDLYIYYILFIN